MNIPKSVCYTTIPMEEGACRLEDWKKVKKRFKNHCYEIIGPYKIGEYMRFNYIHRLDYMDLIRSVFTQPER